MTISELAKRNNIKIGTLSSRILRYKKSPEEALSQTLRPVRKRYITFNDKTKSLKEWGKHLNIEYATLYYRVYISKWPIKKAFNI